MKRLFIILLAAALLCGCAGGQEPSAVPTPTPRSEKISETAYAGTVVKIEDGVLSLKVDNETIPMALSELAQRQLNELGIKVRDRVIANFERQEGDALLVISLEKIVSE